MGPDVTEGQRKEWVDALSRATAHPQFKRTLDRSGLEGRILTGVVLEQWIQHQMTEYQQMAQEFGLLR